MQQISVKKGFTLIEIMIVVAVIGIIISIAVPAFLRARETSRARGCQENLVKLDHALDQYNIEHKDHYGSAGITVVEDFIGPAGVLKTFPVCPGGGSYTLDSAEIPECNYVEPSYLPADMQHSAPNGTDLD